MAQRIILPRSDGDDLSIPVTLGGLRVRLGLRWWQRLSGWYLTLTTESGVVISSERRLCPQAQATVDPTAPGHPAGVLLCVGSGNLDRRGDLWDSVDLVFIPDGEL